ncbi:MAG: type II secretion system protein [Candidatus Eremiobacterota bacterium]
MNKYFLKTGNRGFTLTELLTIVMLIAILATLMFPHIRRALWNTKLSDCLNNQKQFATMIQTYYVENKKFPEPDPNGGSTLPTEGLLPYNKLTPEYTSAYNKRWCPESKKLYMYYVNEQNDNFTISCTEGHPHIGVSPGFPKYMFAGGLFKEASQ